MTALDGIVIGFLLGCFAGVVITGIALYSAMRGER